MYSMPGGFVQRQVNTSLHIPRPKKTQSQPKPETRACQTQKDRELIISVNNRPLSEKVPLPPVFFSLPSFPLERALLCELASEIPTCKSFSRMAQTTLNFSSNILGAFPLVLTSPTARPRAWPPSSGGEELNGMQALVILVNLNENKWFIHVLYLCQKNSYWAQAM